ncbi:MAG: hypothetical protein NC432_10750 [Roseburia sp.]|nr:hypothetical protein [Roseburia sp.]MCM1099290.1 hypothetical protein [Ruminococcus flavefaciens]
MKVFGRIKSKLKLIYTSPLTWQAIFGQVLFLTIYVYAGKITTVSGYFDILRKDLFLWLVCIPLLAVQHRESIYSTSYSRISRIGSRRGMILEDFITLAVSTGLSACIVLSAPLCFLLLRGVGRIGSELLSGFVFLWVRYLLLGLLVQYIIYSLRYTFRNFQKRGGSICVLPFLLYFVFTSPMEILRIKWLYLPFLDFSAGGMNSFSLDGVVLWEAVLWDNLHFAVYLALEIWITAVWLSGRWEFFESEGFF